MSYCHVSNQIALHASKPQAQSFGDFGEWEQEHIVSELAEAVLSDKASLKWDEYPHTITADYARETALEEADFIEELSNAVLHTQDARSLLLRQIKCETKGLVKTALDTTGIAPNGFDFEQILGSEAA